VKHQATSETASIAHQPANSRPIDYATIALLEKWREEDATEDPELLRVAEQELAEFKKQMNENRVSAGEPLLFP
jgi:hypothetical protein